MRAREARIEERVNDVVMGANNFFSPPFTCSGLGRKRRAEFRSFLSLPPPPLGFDSGGGGQGRREERRRRPKEP